jgi:hypothetical protein
MPLCVLVLGPEGPSRRELEARLRRLGHRVLHGADADRADAVVLDGRGSRATWAALLAPLDGLDAPVVAVADDPARLGPLLRERAAGSVVLAADGPDAGLRVALVLCGALGRLASAADVRA